MKNKLRYETEKAKKLERINKKIKRKFYLICTMGECIFLSAVIAADMCISNPIALLVVAGSMDVAMAGLPFFLESKVFNNRTKKNQKIIDKLNIEEEFEKLDEDEKITVKKLTKNEELTTVATKIRNLNLNKDELDILKNAVLNKNIVDFINIVDDKNCLDSLTEYDYDKEKLDKEYQEAIKPKAKKQVKTLNRF